MPSTEIEWVIHLSLVPLPFQSWEMIENTALNTVTATTQMEKSLC